MPLNSLLYKIREAVASEAEGAAYVHVKGWQTSYVGIIEQLYLDNISYDQLICHPLSSIFLPHL